MKLKKNKHAFSFLAKAIMVYQIPGDKESQVTVLSLAAFFTAHMMAV